MTQPWVGLQAQSFTSNERVLGAVVILRSAIQPVFVEDFHRVEDRIRELLHEGKRRFLLNLAGVYVPLSRPYGDLLHCWNETSRNKARFGLCALEADTRKRLDVIDVDHIIPVFDSEEAGIQALNPAEGPAL